MVSDRKLIFVVDDEKLIRNTLRDYLTSREFEVVAIDDGYGVLVQCEKSVPDLIISDVRMPELDGITLLKGLKNRQLTREIPVIFMSGYADDEILAEAIKLGAAHFLFKPFSINAIDEVLKKILP